VVSNTQAFTVAGGSGLYTGASGGGTVKHDAHRLLSGHAAGTDTWEGTLAVPDLEFDLTPPTLGGALDRTVQAPRKAKRVRVAYKVVARDEVDTTVAVSCSPRSGSRFKIGRTAVNCSATDSSANRATARFTITVKARR
jgi:hypothetical protein